MEKTITKAEVVAARQRVLDSEAALVAHAQRNMTGLSNEQMVDVELASLAFLQARDTALQEYQSLLHNFFAQEQVRKSQSVLDEAYKKALLGGSVADYVQRQNESAN